jgi:hypothetical protein
VTTFPRSPRLLKGGIVLVDPARLTVQRTVVLQYNPETLSRTLQGQAAGDHGDRSEALRLTGPPVETLKLDAEVDAAEQLDRPGEQPAAAELGIHPQLAALETILAPDSGQLETTRSLARAGTLEVGAVEAPLSLFVWSAQRVLPVRLTEFSVTEEFFDPRLNPIRARVSLGMRVLTIDDLGFEHRGSGLYMAYHMGKERLAGRVVGGGLSALGIKGIG